MSLQAPAHAPPRALVLGAGVGSRLRPLTDEMPKCLVPVGGRPLLEYWLDALLAMGVRDIWINTHAHAESMREFITSFNARDAGVRLHECHEPVLLGSAGTITANPTVADNGADVLVIYADNLSTINLREMYAEHVNTAAEFTMALFDTPNPSACGIAELDGSGRIVAFEEKPQAPRSNLANAGIYVIAARIYREIAAMGKFDFGFDVIPHLLDRMHGYRHIGFHLDVGTPQAYQTACAAAPGLFASRGQDANGRRSAVFLDRDGTLIEHVHYLADPEQLRLVPGCAAALRRLRAAGFALIMASNQAAVGKGLMTMAALAQVNERLFGLLAGEGVCLDAAYACTKVGYSKDRSVVEHADRKPGPGMLLRGASTVRIALARSYMIGDMLSDALAGVNAGCRASLLIDADAGMPVDERASATHIVTTPSLMDAVDWILADAAGFSEIVGAADSIVTNQLR